MKLYLKEKKESKMSFNVDGLGDPNAMVAGAAALGKDASQYENTSDVEGSVAPWPRQPVYKKQA
jgi:hypothetical protein